MTASFKVDGTNITVTFSYTAPTKMVVDTAEASAHYLWEHGYGDHGTEEAPKLFVDLTNQQKLDLIDQHVRRVILDCAKSYHVNTEQEAARDAASVYADVNLQV